VNRRFLSAKLFFGLSLVSIVVAAALFKRDLPLEFYFSPLFLLLYPRLMPLGVALVSAIFGLIYFAVERRFNRTMSLPLTVAHMASFLLGVFGFVVVTRFWWRVLGQEHATGLAMPVWGALLYIAAFTVSLVAFFANILSRMRRLPERPSHP
jgi:hypothetical protein